MWNEEDKKPRRMNNTKDVVEYAAVVDFGTRKVIVTAPPFTVSLI